MKKFEEGTYYRTTEAIDRYGIIKVLRRTAKYITVRDKVFQWKMLLRVDENGNEYVQDNQVAGACGHYSALNETASQHFTGNALI